MHPYCLKSISNIKRPLDQKEADIRDIFIEVSEIKKQWEMAKTLDVSEESKAEITEAYENKIAACRNAMYEIVESIELTTI